MIQFSDSQREEILEVGGWIVNPDQQDCLFEALESIGNDFINEINHYQATTPTAVKREMTKLKNALKKINHVMGFNINKEMTIQSKVDILDIQNHLHDGLEKIKNHSSSDDSSPQKKYFNIIQSLRELDQCVDVAIKTLSENKEVAGRAADIPMRSLIYRLCMVWGDEKYFNNQISTSVNAETGIPGGPLIRFIETFLKIILELCPDLSVHLPDGDHVIRDRIRDISKDM